MEKSSHVLVVGAGIAGLASAYYLTKAGMHVTVIDKGDGTDNCSYGNAGMVVPSHIIPLASPGIISKGLRWMLKAESPFYIKPRLNRDLLSWGWKFKRASTAGHVKAAGPVLRDFLLRNRELLIDLEKEEDFDFDFQRNGLLMLCRTEKGLEEEIEVAEKAKALGIPAEILSAEETRNKEPHIEMDIIGATYFPKDAHFHPALLMNHLKAWLREKGAEFRFNTEIIGCREVRGKVIVSTADEQEIEGSHAVLCMGAWSPNLTQKMGFNMPMQAGKGYSITLQKPKHKPKICALLAEAKVSMTPMNGDLRFGGTMEIVGHDKTVTPAKIRALKQSVTKYFPEYTLDELNKPEVWVGLRPCSPDGLPYVGKIEHFKNVYTSTGHAMMGMSLSFASGQLVGQLIEQNHAELNHHLVDPNRYM